MSKKDVKTRFLLLITLAVPITLWVAPSSLYCAREGTALAIPNFANPDNDPSLLDWGKRSAEFLTVDLAKDERVTLVTQVSE